jgi:diguanylate cyclase (GGDEF)-like protein
MLTGTLRLRQPTTHARRIESLEQALEQALQLLHHDDLTTLLNRRGFRRACDQFPPMRAVETRMCCAMIDLDNFKSINDQYGHPVGDAALLHFAMTLRQHVRREDALARLGGDEFALVMARSSGIAALDVLARVQKGLMASPLLIHEGSIGLGFSAGVAELQTGESLSDTLIRADAALLEAKHGGKAMIKLNLLLKDQARP